MDLYALMSGFGLMGASVMQMVALWEGPSPETICQTSVGRTLLQLWSFWLFIPLYLLVWLK